MGKRPNLVFIVPDEFRAQAMGFRGEDPVLTPNLDRLSGEGLCFNRAYSNSPVCSPYRGILFTGKYPYENGVITNCNSGNPDCYLRADAVCLPDVLHENGYACGYIGKWHLECPQEEDYPYLPPRRWDGNIWDAYTPKERRHGFTFWHSYGCCDNHFEPHYWETDGEAKDCLHVKQWAPEHETDVAVEYIKNADTQKPFALFIAHNPPHMPFEMVPDKYLELYRDKTAEELLNRPNVPEGEPGSRARASVQQYFAAVSGLDEQLGRVLDAIDEKGIRDNTIVVYTSDHGEMMGSHGRMEKNSFYAESFQIPLLIRYPEKIRPRKTDMLLSTVDLMPTLLTMLGLTDQIPEGLRGQDAGGAILENRDCAIPCALYHHTTISRGFKNDRYTFVIHHEEDEKDRPLEAVLFDDEADPYQMKNLAEKRPELVREFAEGLAGMLEECGDPFAGQVREFLEKGAVKGE